MRLSGIWIWLSPVVLAFALLGFLTARAMHARESEGFWDETVAEQVRALVAREYVDEISNERARELFYAAMEGYLSALDPYCYFYDPEERQAMEEDTSGQFGGVGILVRSRDEGLVVTGIRRGDPAERAGVRIGDVIASVEGRDTRELSMGEVTQLIRGAPGSSLTMGFSRGGERVELRLVRSDIKMDSVVGVRMVDEERGVGYLRVSSFQENTGEHAREALRTLMEQGARSFVLDLRQNRGGVLERGAVGLADLFLTEGTVVETSGRARGSRRVYAASLEGTLCPEAPLVVLVDGGSASAAEVVAGAFQDRRRAVLVGERTYGKFVVQSIHRLPGGNVALQLTTARYYTPYGRWLQRREQDGIRGGLVPDIHVARSEEESRLLLREVFPAQHGLDMIVSAEAPAHPDAQLDRAVLLLRDYEEFAK